MTTTPSDPLDHTGVSAPAAPTELPLGQRLRTLSTLLTPVDPNDPTWRWAIGRLSDPRTPLIWLIGIGGVCVLGLFFIGLQGDAIDFYPLLYALRQVLVVAVVLALAALAVIGWLAFRLRMAASERHEAASALFMRAQTAPPEARADLLDGALAKWREALEVCPRNLGSGAWATTQLCLARAAAQRAQLETPRAADGVADGIAGGDEDPLLQEAVTGYHVALQAQTPQPYAPVGTTQMWLATQRELAATLRLQAERAPESERAQRYEAATAPYRAILAAQAPEIGPRVWADMQIELAATLATAARWAAPPDAIRLLRESATAYQTASEVFLRHASEGEWARLRRTYGDTIRQAAALATNSRGPEGPGYEPARLLDETLVAYAQAQSILTRWVSQGEWAALQLASGQILRERAALEPEPQRRQDILQRAVSTLDTALEVFTSERAPAEWAVAQHTLGEALCDLGALRTEPERHQLLQEAIATLEGAQRGYNDLGETEHAERARAALERAQAALVPAEPG